MSNIINNPTSSDRIYCKQATTIKMQAYAMKLDLLSNATLIDRAVRFVSNHKTGSSIIHLKTWKYKHMTLQGLGKSLDKYDNQLGSNALAVLKELAFHNFQDSADVKTFSHVIGLADFFPPGQQQDARDVSERYIGKSKPWIVMVSTPNAPDGLFERIEMESNETCLYHRVLLDYTHGLHKIYTAEEIAAAKQSPSFEREYNLKYLGLIGNVFHTKDIEVAIVKGKHLKSDFNSYTQKSVGLDPGFGSSNFGLCITELVNRLVNVLHAEKYQRPDFNTMIATTVKLLEEYDIRFDNRCRIFVDGANPSFIRALKDRVDEDINYEQQISFYKKLYPSIYDLQFLQQNMFVIPVAFSKEHKHMLAHCKEMLEYHNGQVAIHPRRNRLITALRTAVENGTGSLDKDATSYCFDSFRLSLQFWR
jgi:hypothetical protein